MAIDARIAMGYQAPQFENPLAQLAQVMQIKGIQNQNRLADLKFQEAERGLAEERNTNELYRLAVGEDGTLDRNKLFTLAGQRGMGSKIPAWQKQFAEADEKAASVGKTKAETSKISQEAVTKALDNNRQTLSYVNDPQTAAQWVAAGFSDPVIGPIFSRSGSLEQAIARIPQDPQGFADWKRQNGLGIEKYIEQSKPNVQIRNTGGTTDTLAINPWTGVGQVTGSVKNTQSPDSVASVAAQIRGQNLTDARGREAVAAQREATEVQRQAQRTQIVDTPNGPMLVDKGTSVGRPVMVNGQALPGETTLKRQQGAGRVLGLLADAEKALPEATNSYLGAGVDVAARTVGVGTKGAQAVGKLRAIEGALLNEMPRMEGPQSNIDVQNYRQAAGQIGDPTVPNSIKKAAIQTIKEIQQRYAGGSALSGGVVDFGSLK